MACRACGKLLETRQGFQWLFVTAEYIRWGFVAQCLVNSSVIVEIEIRHQAGLQLVNGLVALQVNILIFNRSPDALDKDIIQKPPLAVHADLDMGTEQAVNPLLTSKLTPLVCVEYLGRAVFGEGFLKSLQTKLAVHGGGHPPAQNIP